MKRILIFSSCGAGKSTFAKRLQDILGIEIIHLDQHYWKPGWTRTDSGEWQKKVEKFIQGDEWIMDGNYRSSMDLRFPKADTVIWLDFPPLVCLCRILKRRWKNDRADKLDDCRERVSFELLKWVLWKFPRENKKDIKRRIGSLKNRKNVHILKSNKEIDSFLKKLSRNSKSASTENYLREQ